MNRSTAPRAVFDFLRAHWTLCPLTIGRGEIVDPPEPVPFCRARVAEGDGATFNVGGSIERRATLEIISFVPSAPDEDDVLVEIASALDRLLSGRVLRTRDGVSIRLGVVAIGRPVAADGRWTSVSHRVSFTHDAKSGVPLTE